MAALDLLSLQNTYQLNMPIDKKQFKELIIKPSLSAINLLSDDAIELLMLTAATESKLGTYIRQLGVKQGVGAYGVYQIEANTYNYIWTNVINVKPALRAQIQLFCGYAGKPPVERLMSDMSLSTIMARLIYYNVPQMLPSHTDMMAMAGYYKRYYNSILGDNTVENVIADYRKYAL